MKTTCSPMEATNYEIKALGTMHAQHFFIERDVWERSIYDNCRFDIGDFWNVRVNLLKKESTSLNCNNV